VYGLIINMKRPDDNLREHGWRAKMNKILRILRYC
jgi:hypothetical protein